jgi:histidinol-phosphate aminotransferase
MALVPDHIQTLEPYQAGKTVTELQDQYHLDKIVKLASNENPMGSSPLAIRAINNSLSGINRYPHPGFGALRNGLADRYQVSRETVIAGNGSEGIMSLIMRTFFIDDEEALTSEGTFIGFRVLAHSRGIRLDMAPLKNLCIDLNAILERISKKTKIIYLANPNNPTGTIFSKEEFLSFHEKVPSEVLIIMDEAYFEFAREHEAYPDSMQYRFDNVITLRTFSKAYGLAGIRIGYGFAHTDLISNLMKVKLPFEPSIPAQAAGLAALDDEAFLNRYLDLNRRGVAFLYELFERHSIPYIKSYANFVTIVLDTESQVDTLNEKLLRQGVIVRPLKAFGLPHCIRITAGLEEENDIFARALGKALRTGL